MALAWLWQRWITLILNDLLALGVGFGWLWAKSKSLILKHLLALALALGAVDSKGLLGFGNAFRFCNPFVFSNLKNSVALGRGAPGMHFFALLA